MVVYVESAVRSQQAVAAARAVLIRDGVAGLTMRSVATEAEIPLGTLQYVYPTKQRLLTAVIEDVVEEISAVLAASAKLDSGLAVAIRHGMREFWAALVAGHSGLQLVQLELVAHALRTAGLEDLAAWQYRRYRDVVADWCTQAAAAAQQTSALSFDQLARLIVAGIDGLIVQHVVDGDAERSAADLENIIAMIVHQAGIVPA